MAEDATVERQGGGYAGEPHSGPLFDPIALERRLEEARVRRAEALARRRAAAGGDPASAEAPPPLRPGGNPVTRLPPREAGTHAPAPDAPAPRPLPAEARPGLGEAPLRPLAGYPAARLAPAPAPVPTPVPPAAIPPPLVAPPRPAGMRARRSRRGPLAAAALLALGIGVAAALTAPPDLIERSLARIAPGLVGTPDAPDAVVVATAPETPDRTVPDPLPPEPAATPEAAAIPDPVAPAAPPDGPAPEVAEAAPAAAPAPEPVAQISEIAAATPPELREIAAAAAPADGAAPASAPTLPVTVRIAAAPAPQPAPADPAAAPDLAPAPDGPAPLAALGPETPAPAANTAPSAPPAPAAGPGAAPAPASPTALAAAVAPPAPDPAPPVAEAAPPTPEAEPPPAAVAETSPPAPVEPAPATAARIYVHAPATLSEAEVAGAASALRAAGFPEVSTVRIGLDIGRTNIRFFHPADGEAARRAAGALGSDDGPPPEARDFTHFSPSPATGTLEVWLAGAAPVRAPAPVPAAAPAASPSVAAIRDDALAEIRGRIDPQALDTIVRGAPAQAASPSALDLLGRRIERAADRLQRRIAPGDR